jgi:hypothetical protein
MFDGPGHGPFGFFWGVGAFLSGVLITAAVVAVAILLVRYLIVATRAAQLYLDTHQSTPPTAPPPTTTARTPRTPKTPPAA